MNRKTNDRELDSYLQGDSPVSVAYAELANEVPPAALDAAILARATEAVSERPAPDRRRAWLAPLALAATVALSFSVVLHLVIEPQMAPLTEDRFAVAADPPGTADRNESEVPATVVNQGRRAPVASPAGAGSVAGPDDASLLQREALSPGLAPGAVGMDNRGADYSVPNLSLQARDALPGAQETAPSATREAPSGTDAKQVAVASMSDERDALALESALVPDVEQDLAATDHRENLRQAKASPGTPAAHRRAPNAELPPDGTLAPPPDASAPNSLSLLPADDSALQRTDRGPEGSVDVQPAQPEQSLDNLVADTPPDVWLDVIREHFEAGEQVEAREALRRFRKHYPEQRLPENYPLPDPGSTAP